MAAISDVLSFPMNAVKTARLFAFVCIADCHLLNFLHFLTVCTEQRDLFYITNTHALKKDIGFT